jgi:sterol 24-C-methyltransferase
MNKGYYIYQIHSKVDRMSKFIDLEKLINGEKNSLAQIRNYFKVSHWAYKVFHSQDGFMHFRISKSGTFTDEDIYHQPDAIADHIKDGDLVLELGCGQGANLLYLAHGFPKSRFVGVDLIPLKKDQMPGNVTIYEQDYSSIPQLADNSVDVCYAVETIVHNTDKEKIYREVYRVLKPGGVMIIFDYALADRFETYDPKIQMAITLTSKGGSAALFESLEELNTHYTNCGFEIEQTTDYTQETLPDLKHLQRSANWTMNRPWLWKLQYALMPEQFVTNHILGWLGYDAGKAGIGYYMEWVLRKPRV